MTIQQFYQLSEMEKVSVIMEHGKLMAQNTEAEERTFLYRLESFYVFASYNKRDDQLKEISCSPEINHLIPLYRQQLISINPAEREYETPKS